MQVLHDNSHNDAVTGIAPETHYNRTATYNRQDDMADSQPQNNRPLLDRPHIHEAGETSPEREPSHPNTGGTPVSLGRSFLRRVSNYATENLQNEEAVSSSSASPPAPMSYFADVNFGDSSSDSGSAAAGFFRAPLRSERRTVPRRKPRTRGGHTQRAAHGPVGRDVPPGTPGHNLKQVLNGIARECCTSLSSLSGEVKKEEENSSSSITDNTVTTTNLPPPNSRSTHTVRTSASLSYELSDREDQTTLVGMMSHLFDKPQQTLRPETNTKRQASMTLTVDTELDSSSGTSHLSSSSSERPFDEDDRFHQDADGWITLSNLIDYELDDAKRGRKLRE